MSVVAPRRRPRRRAHRSVPLLLGLALLSMAGGARHWHPAALSATSAVSQATQSTVAVDGPSLDAATVPTDAVVNSVDTQAAAVMPAGPAITDRQVGGSVPPADRATPVDAGHPAPYGPRAPPAN